jgi:phospholipid/cholesterol/gamma-HCH transport system substrate-binding protein
MDTKVNYAAVGAFILILTAFLVFGIIWLSSGFSVAKYTTYQVNMQEAVTGLSQDATVEFNGVNVGNVKSIKLNKHDPQSVELLLNVQNDTPVTQGTIATLSTRGITGIAYIALKDKGTDLKPLAKLKGQDYPIITTGPSIFLQLDTMIRKIVVSMKKVSDTIELVFDEGNLQSIKEILASTSIISKTIAKNSERLNVILADTEATMAKFPNLVQSSTNAVQTFQTETLPETNRIIANLSNIADNLSVVSSELRQNPSILIRGKQQAPLGPGEK